VNDDWLALSRRIRKTEQSLDNLRKRKLKSALNTDKLWHLIGEERGLNTRLKRLRKQLRRNAPPDGSTLEDYYPPTQKPDAPATPAIAHRPRHRRHRILVRFAAGCSVALLVLFVVWSYQALETRAQPEPDAASAARQHARQAVQPLTTAQPQSAARPYNQSVVQPFWPIATQPPTTPHPPGDYRLQSPPSLTPQQIDDILRSYQSPAAGTGKIWYRLGVQYGIDPAFALAFFVHESTAGTHANWIGHKLDGTTTHNIGNIICAGYETCYRSYRDYPSWWAGIEDWYRLIDSEYIQRRGLNTIADVIPIYAPPRATPDYIASLEHMVDAWRRKYSVSPAEMDQEP
jgi:hypothetical protein